MFRIKIKDLVTPRMRRMMQRRLDLREWMREGAYNLRRYLQGYYGRKDAAEPNYFVREMMGVRRTHFWKAVGESVGQPIVSRDTVAIPIAHPHIRQKIYGGPILPVRARALTIPVHPDAYGRSAAEVESALGIRLFLRTTALGDAFLMGKVRTGKGKRTSVFRYFILKTAVFQRPWPGSLPNWTAMREAFFRGVRRAIMRD